MVDAGTLGSTSVFAVSVGANLLVLAYRSPRTPWVKSAVDRARFGLTGRSDWSWIRLSYVLVPLVLLTAANLYWQLVQVHCADDSIALYASGRAALTGHDPFAVTYCGGSSAYPIPYGLAAVSLNALGAVGPNFAGIWIVWQLFALAVVPLVWWAAPEDSRYLAVLASCSVLYLPNITTNIGVDNAIVPVAILLGLVATQVRAARGPWLSALAAFFSTARFPAVLPLLGVSGGRPGRRLLGIGLTAGVFVVGVLVSFALWGPDAYRIPYLSQFSRNSGGTLNFFALLVQQGWFHPSLATAAAQGAVVLALVVLVSARNYAPRAAAAIPLLGVMALSQYLSSHFTLWLLPLVLLGPTVNAGVLAYGVLAAVDYSIAEWYLGAVLGIWWPYELLGVVLSALLLYLLFVIVRDEEARRRSAKRNAAETIYDAPVARAG